MEKEKDYKGILSNLNEQTKQAILRAHSMTPIHNKHSQRGNYPYACNTCSYKKVNPYLLQMQNKLFLAVRIRHMAIHSYDSFEDRLERIPALAQAIAVLRTHEHLNQLPKLKLPIHEYQKPQQPTADY